MAGLDVTTIPQGIDVQNNDPLDLRTVKTDAADKAAISIATTFDGLSVYQKSNQKTYLFIGDPEVAGSWVESILDGFSQSVFKSTSGGPGDQFLPVILNALGVIDDTMLPSSNMANYYLKDGDTLSGTMNVAGSTITGLAVATTSTEAVRFDQLSNYLLVGGTAVNSLSLGGTLASEYLDASNLTSGILSDARLNDTLDKNISRNAATATLADTAGVLSPGRTIAIVGLATALPVLFDGSSDIELNITFLPAGSHTHDVSEITGTIDVFDRTFGSGANQVAEGNHAHELLTIGTGLRFTLGTDYRGTTARNIYADLGTSGTQAAYGNHTHPDGPAYIEYTAGNFNLHKTIIDVNGTPKGLITVNYYDSSASYSDGGNVDTIPSPYHPNNIVGSGVVTGPILIAGGGGELGNVGVTISTSGTITYYGGTIFANGPFGFSVTYIGNTTM